MDYFAEIADSPDIVEVLTRLTSHEKYPEHLLQRTQSHTTKSDIERHPSLLKTHPSIWRAELIDWFHRYPQFAATVWQQLAYCESERIRLAHEAWSLSWTLSPLRKWKLIHTHQFLNRLWSKHVDGQRLCREEFCGLDDDTLDKLRTALGLGHRGPSFIDRLADYVTDQPRQDIMAKLIGEPLLVRDIAAKHGVPVPFSIVLDDELLQIKSCREERDGTRTRLPDGENPSSQRGTNVSPGHGEAPLRHALSRNLVGLAFSGGGIRSATFNLGVLQALAKLDVLRHCDYLSTVSGGGYIGSWFTAWMHREGEKLTDSEQSSKEEILEAHEVRLASKIHDLMRLRLSPTRSPNPIDTRIRAIRYLREFSNYLTPKTGFFSADTWTMIAIYIRNLLLNLLVLVPLIAAVLLIPRLAFDVAQWLPTVEPWWTLELVTWLPVLPMGWTTVTIVFFGMILPLSVLIPNLWRTNPPPNQDVDEEEKLRFEASRSVAPWYARQGMIQVGVVIPFLLAACVTATSYHHAVSGNAEQSQHIEWVSILASLAFLLYLGSIHFAGRFYNCWPSFPQAMLSLSIATVGAAAAAAGLFWLLGNIFATFADGQDGAWLAISFGTPITLAAYSFIVVIQLGLLGTRFPDEQREWWSRLRAWTLIYSVAWTALFGFAIWSPYLLHWVWGWMGPGGGMVALGTWAVSTYAGIWAARATQPPSDPETGPAQSRLRTVVVLLAPYVFVVGLLALISLVNHLLLAWGFNKPRWDDMPSYPFLTLLLIGLVLGALSIFVSWRIGVNEFSMHHFYKNRLVRCYLGASRWQYRKADWFTGFDSNDDIHLSRLDHNSSNNTEPLSKYWGPYPIVNATVNLVAGEDLAWQERKATSFIFTPKYCGYDVDRAVMQAKGSDGNWPDAYAPTHSYVYERTCPETSSSRRDCGGPTLGTAMAISGAAANPNMGKVTSAASAFLMTVFNVRLGWWLPNTRHKRHKSSWSLGTDNSAPKLGINYTAIELFGMTDDKKKFLNLSDGGHFENLGIYELIRRGCRYVIASDAGQDGALGLEDLGNLIRKCRTDFGVEIDLGLDSIRERNLKGWSDTHCVVGKIHYLGVPSRDENGHVRYDRLTGQPEHETGVIVYMKPTITGDEPFDILEYYKRVPNFPHESTADQWFNESQFESYRRLGLHIAEMTFKRFREQPDEQIQNIGVLFDNLKSFWTPSSPKVAEHSTDHTKEYSRIMEMLRSQNHLSFLDSVLFKDVGSPGLNGRRDEFYICNALIQLMENVYADLDLEQNYDHPHVEGWMRVFRSWAREPSFQRTWELSQNTYASRFRRFYEDRLL